MLARRRSKTVKALEYMNDDHDIKYPKIQVIYS